MRIPWIWAGWARHQSVPGSSAERNRLRLKWPLFGCCQLNSPKICPSHMQCMCTGVVKSWFWRFWPKFRNLCYCYDECDSGYWQIHRLYNLCMHTWFLGKASAPPAKKSRHSIETATPSTSTKKSQAKTTGSRYSLPETNAPSKRKRASNAQDEGKNL